jgi:hypothetical protein
MINLGVFRNAVLGLALLGSASVGWSEPSTVGYAGNVLAVDPASGSIVVGDMGPLLADGHSDITRRSIRVTPSTELAKVVRAPGIAPSGWIGDYVARDMAPSELKLGDFVAVTATHENDSPQALKITVVEISGQ